jgi:hypothetical protein
MKSEINRSISIHSLYALISEINVSLNRRDSSNFFDFYLYDQVAQQSGKSKYWSTAGFCYAKIKKFLLLSKRFFNSFF